MARVVPGQPVDCAKPLTQNSTPKSSAELIEPNAAQAAALSSMP